MQNNRTPNFVCSSFYMNGTAVLFYNKHYGCKQTFMAPIVSEARQSIKQKTYLEVPSFHFYILITSAIQSAFGYRAVF